MVRRGMYQPSQFQERDLDRIADLVQANPLATIVSSGGAEGLTADHVPLLLDRSRTPAVLLGHIARANPLWRNLPPEVLVLFNGPHAYVPSLWYGAAEENVPTWNYAVVHAIARPRLLDRSGTLAVIRRLVAHFQPQGHPLPLDPPAPQVEELLGAIVGFELEVVRWEAKFKLSQNREPADQERVRARLRERGEGTDLAVAALMDGNLGGSR
jgi:transcriptional regulator